MDTSMLLIGAIVLFILVVMFIVVYGGPSTVPIAAPIPPVLQADTKDCGCPKKDKCREDCPKKKEHKKDCGCDPCRKRRRRSDPDGPYYAHGGRRDRDDYDDLLYDDMDGFADGVAESKPAPFTIGTPA
jgi:hypothetical protein